MRKVFDIALLLLPLIAVVDSASYVRRLNNVTTDLENPESRQLQVQNDFQPLLCNAGLASATCKTWSSTFGIRNTHFKRVVIPCGQCVTMNHGGATLDLRAGLEIIGKLVIPNKTRIHILTTTVVVQGELQMTSSKPIDGNPDIKFTLNGNSDIKFTPIDRNAKACHGVATCSIGKKSIVVAGGKLNVRGIPSGTPTWTRLYDVTGGTFNNPTTLLLPSLVKGKWAIGAQILITSHTRIWNEHQQRTITKIVDSSVSGYVAVTLDSAIIRPTTIVESKEYAVEVALLSRNILLVGGTDTTARHGGHLMIMQTPNVVQSIIGLELRNFGQQGELGKYPIHFHFCNDVPGSVVSQNSIRQSNQRCVVVHGTNKLRVSENIAYDTKGHCFMTEDGYETGNEFVSNLGAQTGIPEVIIPNLGSNGYESDKEPATFWISSPTNSWLGNVAAGSINSGYWFEPILRGERASLYPNKNPVLDPIVLFKDNVGHSNAGSTGALRLYTPGYTPTSLATFEGLRIYRNSATGIFVHRSSNILILNSHFADNNIGIDLDRTEGIEVRNAVVIGESASYRSLMARQSVERVCRNMQDRWLIGIDLHTWKKDKTLAGATLSNVTLSGFKNVQCLNSASIKYDSHNLKQGLFEFYTAFKNVKNTDGPDKINFCAALADGIKMMYFIDLDGSLKPSQVSTPGPATLLASDGGQLTTFVSPSKCTNVALGCYSYCADTCFRSVRYEVNIVGKVNPMLKVCRRDNRSICTQFFGGKREGETLAFIAHLPVGQLYDAVFVDGSGAEFTAANYQEFMEPSLCPTGGTFGVQLYNVMPKA